MSEERKEWVKMKNKVKTNVRGKDKRGGEWGKRRRVNDEKKVYIKRKE